MGRGESAFLSDFQRLKGGGRGGWEPFRSSPEAELARIQVNRTHLFQQLLLFCHCFSSSQQTQREDSWVAWKVPFHPGIWLLPPSCTIPFLCVVQGFCYLKVQKPSHRLPQLSTSIRSGLGLSATSKSSWIVAPDRMRQFTVCSLHIPVV